MKNYFLLVKQLALLLLCVSSSSVESDSQKLSLNDAVELAIKNDTWLVSNSKTQDSIESRAIAEGSLPDPKLSFDVANLPTDSFKFNQEMMTQAKIGFSQKFPRGESLALKQRQSELSASKYPLQREDRKAHLKVLISQLWLDVYKAKQSIHLIENDRSLFEQLVDIAQINYASTIGKTRQQDIIRAQLELTRLDDRLISLKQKKDSVLTELSYWVTDNIYENKSETFLTEIDIQNKLPIIQLMTTIENLERKKYNEEKNEQVLFDLLSNHPKLKVMNQRVAISKNKIQLAKENYQSEWDLRASYAYRDNDPIGIQRQDFFSVGITFDLPIFTNNKQDKLVISAKEKSQSEKIEKWLLAKQMVANFKKEKSQLERVGQRINLYEKFLLPQMQQQAEASLTAYTNDDGGFSEVVRSRIALLNANIDFLNIKIEKKKTITNMNYLLTGNKNRAVANGLDKKSGEK